jgi:hypothetical protein
MPYDLRDPARSTLVGTKIPTSPAVCRDGPSRDIGFVPARPKNHAYRVVKVLY